MIGQDLGLQIDPISLERDCVELVLEGEGGGGSGRGGC
jgi:hypothetical protein